MLKNVSFIVLCCAACILAEPPASRYRAQRFRQAPPSRQVSARQQAPYPDAQTEPSPAYGAPPNPTPPASQYGAPPQPDTDQNGVVVGEAEAFAGPEPSRLTAQKLTLPSAASPPKFAQRLELQQQVQLPARQVAAAPLQYTAQLQPVGSVAGAAVLPYAQIQPAGSYYVQLPSGDIQRVAYLTQPDPVDGAVYGQLQFRPVARAQAVVTEPEVYVNTVVQAYTAAE